MVDSESKPAWRTNGAADRRRVNDEHAQTDQLEEPRASCQPGYDVQGAGVRSLSSGTIGCRQKYEATNAAMPTAKRDTLWSRFVRLGGMRGSIPDHG